MENRLGQPGISTGRRKVPLWLPFKALKPQPSIGTDWEPTGSQPNPEDPSRKAALDEIKWSLGYRGMCRFRSGTIFLQPVLQKFQYAMTLDGGVSNVDPHINQPDFFVRGVFPQPQLTRGKFPSNSHDVPLNPGTPPN